MAIDLHGHCTPMPYIEALLRREDYPRARAAGDGYRIEVGERAAFAAGPRHWDIPAGVLAPYLAAVAAAGGFVLVHPGSRVETRGLPAAFPFAANTAGFQNELTVALFRLVFGGLLDAAPAPPVVFVNLGGAAPLLAER